MNVLIPTSLFPEFPFINRQIHQTQKTSHLPFLKYYGSFTAMSPIQIRCISVPYLCLIVTVLAYSRPVHVIIGSLLLSALVCLTKPNWKASCCCFRSLTFRPQGAYFSLLFFFFVFVPHCCQQAFVPTGRCHIQHGKPQRLLTGRHTFWLRHTMVNATCND